MTRIRKKSDWSIIPIVPKTLCQLLMEIEEEIKITKKCMKEDIKNGNLESALGYQHSIRTLEFVLELASGRLG